jgi:hypothetical protein
MFIIKPNVGLPFTNAQNFLHCVQMGWRPMPRVAPLLEHAKLGCAIFR